MLTPPTKTAWKEEQMTKYLTPIDFTFKGRHLPKMKFHKLLQDSEEKWAYSECSGSNIIDIFSIRVHESKHFAQVTLLVKAKE